MTSPAPPLTHRQNNFDAVRIIAALAVLVSHQFALSARPESGVLGVHSWGGVGVLVFFSISGFLVAQSWDNDPRALPFMARRLLRVWPALAVAVTLTAVVLMPLVGSMPWREYFADPLFTRYFRLLRFSNQLFLPTGFDGNHLGRVINGSLWTIPIEMKCYVVLTVFGLLGLLRARWRWLVAAATLLIGVVYLWAPPEALQHRFAYNAHRSMPLEFGLCFFIGVVCHHHRRRTTGRAGLPLLLASWVLGVLSIALDQPLLALVFLVPLTAIWFGTASWPVVRRMGRFGDLSYGLYIYAFPMQQLMIWWFHDRLPWVAVLALSLLSTVALAYASWHLVEKHALRLKPRAPQAAGVRGAGALA